MKRSIIFLFMALCATSCVSPNKYRSVLTENVRFSAHLESAAERIADLSQRNNDLARQNDTLAAELASLREEHSALEGRYRTLLADGSAEASRMLRQLEENQRELDARTKRMEELEQMLRAREAALVAIRRKVADALLGFEGKGLSITTRDGKVYVSMDDKLLFRSGSFEVDPRGAEAVRELSTVLAQNPDINVMVEGHTDDVPYRGSGNLKDNLDLSAKRATTVTRLLLENRAIDPSRIIAAGRGESLPVAAGTTPEARAMNRRTEIILTPKLDELMQLMDK